MVTDKVLITIIGATLILFIYWFFLSKKEKEIKILNNEVDIIVNGGYSPEVISIPLGKTTKINFIRKDSTECLSEVVLGDFKIKRELPLNQKVMIEITPKKKGEFEYSCGMGMYHGKIMVK
ncbi:MAG: cupredoxin domain-containing protein [Candidatus Daviesbacteria bacterium]|nr:cupredoxin domain-containing protein [Candidatus Daviesbacteria bacterium]